MKYLQFRGPFKSGESIDVIPPRANYADDITFTFRHIGIQIPKKQPIIKLSKASDIVSSYYSADVKINDNSYRVSQTGLLEFDNLSLSSCLITFLKNLDADTIIDIGYEPTQGE